MPSTTHTTARPGSHEPDELDRYFNDDDAVEDFLRDLPIDRNGSNNDTPVNAERAKDIDEEIKIRKKRRPNPKLDDDRLLSDNGIPRLRKITKTRLKFRGKGHEFGDIARLLETYQLWLDDLYPRAKFRDALGMVEKVGHSKRMQISRRAWLDETKPFRRDASPEMNADVEMGGARPVSGVENGGIHTASGDEQANAVEKDPLRTTDGEDRVEEHSDGAPDDDELDALLAENEARQPLNQVSANRRKTGPFDEDSDEDEDELDALLNTEPSVKSAQSHPTSTMKNVEAANDFADEEEAMAEIEGW